MGRKRAKSRAAEPQPAAPPAPEQSPAPEPLPKSIDGAPFDPAAPSPPEPALAAPQLELFTNELVAFRHYLDAEFHLRPLVQVERAWIGLDGQRIPLRADPREDHVVLTGHGLIPGIHVAPAATVELRGAFGHVSFGDLVTGQLRRADRFHIVSDRVQDRLTAEPLEILEIGSRQRADTATSPSLRQVAKRYVGVDLLPGPNVDLVADAHRLDALLPAASFDFVYSQFVFEHLAMPWVVVAQVNRLLRDGGEAFVVTNQTIGLHDLPWDFWRYSESAWTALFNPDTGFAIIESGVGEPVRITPMRYHDAFRDHEGGVGFQASFAWVRKTADRVPAWPVDPDTIFARLARPYPKEVRD